MDNVVDNNHTPFTISDFYTILSRIAPREAYNLCMSSNSTMLFFPYLEQTTIISSIRLMKLISKSKSMTNLTLLTLSCNDSILKLIPLQLTHLTLHGNLTQNRQTNLKLLPQSLTYLSLPTDVKMRDRDLSFLPRNLKYLHLQKNTCITGRDLYKLNITDLDLSSNHNLIIDNITNLDIKSLRINEEVLTDDNVQYLPSNLEELECNTQYDTLSSQSFKLLPRTLTKLILSNFQVYPEDLSNLPNLKYLHLSDNRNVISPHQFKHLPRTIEHLSIVNNHQIDCLYDLPPKIRKLEYGNQVLYFDGTAICVCSKHDGKRVKSTCGCHEFLERCNMCFNYGMIVLKTGKYAGIPALRAVDQSEDGDYGEISEDDKVVLKRTERIYKNSYKDLHDRYIGFGMHKHLKYSEFVYNYITMYSYIHNFCKNKEICPRPSGLMKMLISYVDIWEYLN